MLQNEFVFLLLLLVPVSVLSVCYQGLSFPSSVLPPAVVSRVGSMIRVPSSHSLPRCVEAACAFSRADLAWFFQGRCYVVSCQQRALCRPQTRPGSQSHIVFIQRSRERSQDLYWGEYKSSEAPGDLQALKDLGLLRSQLDYDDPDLEELDFPLSLEETDLTDQSELTQRDGLNQSDAGNATTPTAAGQPQEPTQRPPQAQVQMQSVVSSNLTSDSDPNAPVTSLPLFLKTTSLPASVATSASTVSSPALGSSQTTESARASPSTNIQTNQVQSTPVQTSRIQSTPVQTSRIQSTPVQTSRIQSTPVQTSRIQSTPVQTSRIQSNPIQSNPVQSTPVQSNPVQSGLIQSERWSRATSAPCSPPAAPSVHSGVLSPVPVAHAGGSYSLTLPNSSIVLQGSVTNTDPDAVHYLWTRDAQSPAAGEVLFGSEFSPSLVLVGLVEGSYLFHLRVTDAQGRSAAASATVQVLPEAGGAEEVELEMQVSICQVSVSQRDTVVGQLSALLRVPPSNIQQRGLYGHAQLSTVLRFSVHSSSGPVPGSSLVSVLKNHLLRDRTEYLLFRVLRVDTVVCQLRCSGRGQCDPVTRLCLCDPFWTENLLRFYIGDGQSNCEWRVLYVILSGFILVLLILTAAWSFMCCCRRKRQGKVRRKTRYTILDNVDEQERVELRPKFSLKHRSTEHNSSLMMSESELSDQDFRETPLRSRNRTKPGLNQL